jgi:hypothetical protein
MTDINGISPTDEDTRLSAIRAERAAAAKERSEVNALDHHLSGVRYDTCFLEALRERMHRLQNDNPDMSINDAAKHVVESIAHDTELAALKPAFDKLKARIQRYNANPADNSWRTNPDCWAEFVTARRMEDGTAKQRGAA